MAILYIVATPIGNLEDMTKRALRILSEVDLILCEDTRVTKKLLEHYQISTPTLSYHQHSKIQKIDHIANLLKEGKSLALVSDAGTPGVSDPGNKLIEEITASGISLDIVPLPGSSAAMAAASISGFNMDRFLFLGFPPVKKKRKKFFEEMMNSEYPVIFYESPYRIIKTLKDLQLGAESRNLQPKIVVCRELTKKFETIYRGNVADVIDRIEQGICKGEFVVVLEGKK
ncbi:MAG: 16S rRNA (cytidine(1402)-2'-O)-methyltransferase [bacterium]|nr:16S rRNA (cytidine(1402)-2'-O)-methyltransferase [bacterium]